VETKLSDLLFESKATNKDQKYSKEDVLSVSGQDGIVNQIKHLGRSYAGVSVRNYHVVDKGDIVYTKSPLKANPYGIIKINKGNPGIVSTLYAVYKTKINISGSFLDHYFKLDANVNRYLRPLVKKGAKNDMKINNYYVLHDKIAVPELSEQIEIARFLDLVDMWLSNIRSQKQELENYKKGLIQKIFSQKIRFKDTKDKDYPEWEQTSLGENASFLKGAGIAKDDIQSEGKNECIRYGELYTEYKETINIVKSRTNIPTNKSTLSKSGDILIPSSGETAIDISTASCILKDDVLLGGDLNIIRLNKNNNGVFYAYYLKNYANRAIAKIAQGNSVVHLYSSGLKKIKIYRPSVLEQQKIANFLTSLDKLIESKQNQINEAENWKKGLLQQVFI